ncbi:hypothetical protein N656DRAFT_778998 [Canariomyces notabilis]|uniref:Uncharacterized protein n=1 Tax=Canariomyces notabilis TaxID=2074819 RepID=A0AAN6TFA0_9PEZI|nr:hypothetical protein N656DRAFT_778998 [Canariomyces arenarius]
MRHCKAQVALTAFQLLVVGAAQENEFFRWSSPNADVAANVRRQTPPPGYHPEFGSCGSGTTCEDACGPNWESCDASTTLSLFCYNRVDLNQTCCANGSGRACESGYYCAWQEFGGRVWCCENGQSLEECGLPGGTATTTISGGPSSTSSSSGQSDTTGTGTKTDSSAITSTSQCPAVSTVTSWATTTVISTVSVPVTVTANEGCSSGSLSMPSSSTGSATATTSATVTTQPPASSSTAQLDGSSNIDSDCGSWRGQSKPVCCGTGRTGFCDLL